MPFFVRGGGNAKKKPLGGGGSGKQSSSGGRFASVKAAIAAKRPKIDDDEEISSDSDVEPQADRSGDEAERSEQDSDAEDTLNKMPADRSLASRRLQAAKRYLARVAAEDADEQPAEAHSDDEDTRHSTIANKLKMAADAAAGRLYRQVASGVAVDTTAERQVRAHRRTPTCLKLTSDATSVVSATKSGALSLSDVETGKTIWQVGGHGKAATKKKAIGHEGAVLCLDLDFTDKILATGGADKLIHVWDVKSGSQIKTLQGHRGPITSMCFRRGHQMLFSGSADRSVKAWDLSQMGYVDTMFGHTDSVQGVTALSRERSISCGARDRSIRIWKLADESQLVFNVPERCASVDCVSMINEDHFVSGAQDGSISVWSTFKKKPVHTAFNAHDGSSRFPAWIYAVHARPYTDLVASGSCDGSVRLWQVARDYKSITPVARVPIEGFVNGLSVSGDSAVLACAVGSEPAVGRWALHPTATNRIICLPITYS